MTKRIFSLILLIAIAASLISCSDEAKFGHAELVLPLGDDYHKSEAHDGGYDKVYTNGKRIVALARISFEALGMAEFMTPYEFGSFWLDKYEREAELITSDGGTAYATYYDGYGDSEVFYLEAFVRTPHAYFVILCATPVSDRDEAKEYFLDLIDRVYIKNKG